MIDAALAFYVASALALVAGAVARYRIEDSYARGAIIALTAIAYYCVLAEAHPAVVARLVEGGLSRQAADLYANFTLAALAFSFVIHFAESLYGGGP